ncbi:hypothetical protein ANCCAN_01883 [Ancylostoma caninum]|uniref:GT23 domain-containing protein n=1 Tax=Ancylostoma caninum TaxID=29170 RepID=A0A368HA25_ANCCA|nr:hypothetical protein ANCCAN_01883 [Ancylostoma caninum]
MNALKLILLVAVIWLPTVFFFSKSTPPEVQENYVEMEDQVFELQKSLRMLQEMNRDLKYKLKELVLEEETAREVTLKKRKGMWSKHSYNAGEYERGRRKLERGLWEILISLSLNDSVRSTNYREHTENKLVSLLATSSKLDLITDRKKSSLRSITDIIQKELNTSQHIDDCSKVKFLGCSLPGSCGFGCQVHHLTYCLLVAFASSRVLVIRKNAWGYHREGWAGAFHPPSTCQLPEEVNWSTKESKATDERSPAPSVNSLETPFSDQKFFSLDPIMTSSYRPDYLPLSIPKPVADQLIALHSNPPVFFIGQFARFILNPKPSLQKFVDISASQVPFNSGPIVGVHVRRTDKIDWKEAKYHPVSEYMRWCEIYFQIQERRLKHPLRRKVYVASDDPSVIREIREKYPNYDVFGDVAFAESAQNHSGRYSERSLRGLVTDVFLLSKCDYLVCGLSSHLCRLAYELMQVVHDGDAGDRVRSLDEMYYFGGQHPHEYVAIEEHTPQYSKEISLEIGDVIEFKTNLWNGYFEGGGEVENCGISCFGEIFEIFSMK